MPTPGALIATYVRLKTEFEEIVVVEKQYSPGKMMAPIEDEEMAPGGMRSPGELHKVPVVVLDDSDVVACPVGIAPEIDSDTAVHPVDIAPEIDSDVAVSPVDIAPKIDSHAVVRVVVIAREIDDKK